MGYFGVKNAHFVHLRKYFSLFSKNRVFWCSIAPCVFAVHPKIPPSGALCPIIRNPPIYTVLNAAFSAPPPPAGTPWWKSTPGGLPGGPPRYTASRSARYPTLQTHVCPNVCKYKFLYKYKILYFNRISPVRHFSNFI